MSILSGDWDWSKQYLGRKDDGDDNNNNNNNAMPRIVLETRLDADDGLHENFVEHMQSKSRILLAATAAGKRPQWRIWCASGHLEWQNQIEWKDPTIEASLGGIIGVKSNGGCISAGLTVGYRPDVSIADVPPMKHDQLHHSLKACKQDKEDHDHHDHPSGCRDTMDLAPTAIRARTPTSAGMWNVLWRGDTQHVDPRYLRGILAQEHNQKKLWHMAESRFGFTRDMAKDLRKYLESHIHNVASDNLDGQCTNGHSCKSSSRTQLATILHDTAET